MLSIKELELKIKKASQDYYFGTSEVPDSIFDSWVSDLKELDPNNPLLVQVGWGATVYGNKVKHETPIRVSIPKVHTLEELQLLGFLKGSILNYSLKLDGLTIVLTFKQGLLKSAITRGDGIFGVDVTEKFRSGMVKDFDLLLSLFKEESFSGTVRGEAIILYKDFEDLKDNYSNPRNAVAGIINAKNLNNLEKVSFRLHPESVRSSILPRFKTNIDLGRKIVAECSEFWSEFHPVKITESFNVEFFKTIYESYKDIYPIDGIVLEFNDIIKALKFKTEAVETIVSNVEWTESSKGALIPVVSFTPVSLYGATVKQATGISFDWIITNGVIPGVHLKVTRANEVIPQILEVLNPSSYDETLEYWKSHIENFQDYKIEGVNLINNTSLSLRVVKSFADSTLRFKDFNKGSQLITEGLGITNIADYIPTILKYQLDPSNLKSICLRYSNRSTVDELYSRLTGKISCRGFFSKFGLRGFGIENALKLDSSLQNLLSSGWVDTNSYLKYINTLDVNITCKSWLKNLDLIKDISKLYKDLEKFNLIESNNPNKLHREFTLKVVITGALDKPRKYVVEELESKNIKVSENIREEGIQYLICENLNSTSSKMKYAKDHNIKTLTYSQFRALFAL